MITFLATIPAVQSALKFGGDAARVTFEVPASEVEHAVGLIALKDTPLRVTVEVDNGESESGAKEGGEAEGEKAQRKLPQNFRF